MKTFKNLYPKIYDFENLEQAFRKARRGKRHKNNVATFELNLDQELLGYNLLALHIACPPTLRLIQRIIASGQGIHDARYEMQWFPGDDLLAAARPPGGAIP